MNCSLCEKQAGDLGEPSKARWMGPDGEAYCSMHFTSKFGHGERLVKIENYEPPAKAKAPAKRRRKKKEAVNG